jgi:hypothetical protein
MSGWENRQWYEHNNIVYEENGYEICDVFDKKAALLIVKSPELYAMLKEIVECGLISPVKENVIQEIKELLKEAGGGESEHRTSNAQHRTSNKGKMTESFSGRIIFKKG